MEVGESCALSRIELHADQVAAEVLVLKPRTLICRRSAIT